MSKGVAFQEDSVKRYLVRLTDSPRKAFLFDTVFADGFVTGSYEMTAICLGAYHFIAASLAMDVQIYGVLPPCGCVGGWVGGFCIYGLSWQTPLMMITLSQRSG